MGWDDCERECYLVRLVLAVLAVLRCTGLVRKLQLVLSLYCISRVGVTWVLSMRFICWHFGAGPGACGSAVLVLHYYHVVT